MKQIMAGWLMGVAATGWAATLALNTPCEEVIKSEDSTQTVVLASEATVSKKATMVFSAQLVFTWPSVKPTYDSTAKLAIAADKTGELLVADGASGGWKGSGYIATEGSAVDVRAVGKLNEAGVLCFEVTFASPFATADAPGEATARSVEVVSPASGATLQAVDFTGEGTASGLTLALVNTAILPESSDGKQDDQLVSKYVEWANGTGSALADASEAEQQDAFAMNVGSKPSLVITAIDPIARTITVKGLAAATGAQAAETGSADQTVDLTRINGVLTIRSQETLGGATTVQRVALSAGTGELVRVTFPEGANFVQAAVTVAPPAETASEPAQGEPVAEAAEEE